MWLAPAFACRLAGMGTKQSQAVALLMGLQGPLREEGRDSVLMLLHSATLCCSPLFPGLSLGTPGLPCCLPTTIALMLWLMSSACDASC